MKVKDIDMEILDNIANMSGFSESFCEDLYIFVVTRNEKEKFICYQSKYADGDFYPYPLPGIPEVIIEYLLENGRLENPEIVSDGNFSIFD